MAAIHEEYVIDDKGNKKAVLLPLKDWQFIKAELEELEEIRAYDRAKERPSDSDSFTEKLNAADTDFNRFSI